MRNPGGKGFSREHPVPFRKGRRNRRAAEKPRLKPACSRESRQRRDLESEKIALPAGPRASHKTGGGPVNEWPELAPGGCFTGGNPALFKGLFRAEDPSSVRKRRMGYLLTSLRGRPMRAAGSVHPPKKGWIHRMSSPSLSSTESYSGARTMRPFNTKMI